MRPLKAALDEVWHRRLDQFEEELGHLRDGHLPVGRVVVNPPVAATYNSSLMLYVDVSKLPITPRIVACPSPLFANDDWLIPNAGIVPAVSAREGDTSIAPEAPTDPVAYTGMPALNLFTVYFRKIVQASNMM